jgi:hypothetical protein
MRQGRGRIGRLLLVALFSPSGKGRRPKAGRAADGHRQNGLQRCVCRESAGDGEKFVEQSPRLPALFSPQGRRDGTQFRSRSLAGFAGLVEPFRQPQVGWRICTHLRAAASSPAARSRGTQTPIWLKPGHYTAAVPHDWLRRRREAAHPAAAKPATATVRAEGSGTITRTPVDWLNLSV